ncbi:AAA family ATPase [Photobacterium phosphoreum]|uniref:AAA family ATPase n=1 Tax=Photobacterium phosphoreum TaxID=659 RepID=A0AAW4ZZW0_PHOPO|nr:AAA family ATPase [Photobacterium phosphoreum]MCD9492595.1 AAA family ATPase [Photobacterium phosphoreum]MCF2191840.1 AAA family ATPase [Photobacterium phosphoreum]MCF2303427.1 AAA family ATPase [Photobacterium phosphoreum]
MNKLIVVGNTKGGCGKSTLVMSLAAEASRRDNKVVIVDADPTSVLKYWCSVRGVECIHVASTLNISSLLIELKTKHQTALIIVDTGGFDSKAARSAITAKCVDIVIFPVKTSPLDLFVTRQFLKEALPYLNHVKPLGVIMEADHLQNATGDILAAKDLLRNFGVEPLKNFTIKRKVYRENFMKGGDHLKNEKARNEVAAIYDELRNIK